MRLTLIILFVIAGLCSYAQPRAAFTASPTRGCLPVLVRFTDQSTGNPTEWRWNLGNGTTSTQRNPTVTYLNAGRYDIKLTVRNAQGADSLVKQGYIVINPQPTVAFVGSDTTGCFPLTVRFRDLSTPNVGTISSWQWDFGDGTSSTEQNPTHIYNIQGNFNVSLKITNSEGCISVLTKPTYIRLNNGAKPAFTYTAPPTCAPPSVVQFTNISTVTGTASYLWDFGDGTTSTAVNPQHTYTTAGTYTVRLTASNNAGCANTLVKTNLISIGTVRANFNMPDSVCVKTNFQITNTSTPATAASEWYFSDGTTSNLINPVKRFDAPGTYTVRLVNDFGVCQESITKSVVVRVGPVASMGYSQLIACARPITYNFNTSGSVNAVGAQWSFGDGGVSNQLSPSHSFGDTGNYVVTLVVADNRGCTDTQRQTITVRTNRPKVNAISPVYINACLPYTYTPSADVTATQADPIASWQWNFGDGSTGTGANPAHTYTTAGVYVVSLVVTTVSGCKDTLSVTGAVSVGNKPTASFYAAPLLTCAQDSVKFFNTSIGPSFLNYLWYFGDGGASTLDSPSHQYQDTGYFDVTLIAFSYGCSDTIKLSRYVRILGPVAKFIDTFDCGNPLRRIFLDRSIGARRWRWDFGDGSFDTIQNPIHTYASLGTYEVKLWVTNDTCEFTKTKKIDIFKIRPDFNAVQPFACRNNAISFVATNIDTTKIASYTWLFGDGQSSQTIAPRVSHVYNWPDNFTVTLVTTDINGCQDSIVKPAVAKIYGPTALFGNAGGCLGKTLVFADSSLTDGVHPIVNWQWNFGDGTNPVSTTGGATHVYSAIGYYDVELIVTDNIGCKNRYYVPNAVFVTDPQARFEALDTLICAAAPVRFVNQSFGSSLRFLWDFADGSTTTDVNPVHLFASEGNYNVALIVRDINNCVDTFSRNQPIVIANAKAAFLMSDSFSTCPPLIVDFTNQSFNADSVFWDFDDGGFSSLRNPRHFYSFSGDFRVKLKVFGNGGCTDTASKVINIKGPSGSFSYDPLVQCKPAQVNFTSVTRNAVNYIWDFNNGQTLTTPDSVATFAYTTLGRFVPKLILQDSSGCSVPIQGLDTIQVFGVNSRITANASVYCDSGFVQLNSDSLFSNDPVLGFSWDFGDGNTNNTVRNPGHRYTQPGTYTVRFITRTAIGCVDTALLPLPIKIVRSPQPVIVGDSARCVPATIPFSASLSTPDSSAINWAWNVAGGLPAPGNINQATVTYITPGTYNIGLTATNSSGCVGRATKSIVVNPLPNIDAGPDSVICRGQSISLRASGATLYDWSSANNTLSCFNCLSPLASPLTNSTYFVSGTDGNGCSAKDSILIYVQQPQVLRAEPGDTICEGQRLQLTARGTDLYSWEPPTALTAPNAYTTFASPRATTTYKIVGSDVRGCFRDSAFVRVDVFPYPRVNVLPDSVVVMQNGGAGIQLSGAISNDVISYTWDPVTTLSCSACLTPLAKPNQTTTYTLRAKNIAGCASQDRVTVQVLCDGKNIFIPNTFSPNSDGMNDVFFPRGVGLFSIKTMRIFNRWGELIFERRNCAPNDMACGWNGNYDNKPASQDVYVYYIEVLCDNTNLLVLKGNVTLMR
jgi:gliding motility-associated-like protein